MGKLFQVIGQVLGLPNAQDLQAQAQAGIDQATLAVQILIAEGAVIAIEGIIIIVALWKLRRKS